MGSDRTYREEGEARRVRVDGFWIDPTEVTVEPQLRQCFDAIEAAVAAVGSGV